MGIILNLIKNTITDQMEKHRFIGIKSRALLISVTILLDNS